MDVFISWSGSLSNRIAALLRLWLKINLQSTNPFLSSKDIGNGAQWSAEINDRLQKSKFGIICLTSENKNAPWILFESGACSKGLKENKIATILIDLDYSDIEYPLAQFHHTFFNKDSFKGLLKSINKTLQENDEMYLDDEILNEVFENNWVKFESDFKNILTGAGIGKDNVTPKNKNDKILEDILESIRGVEKRISMLEFKNETAKLFYDSLNIDKRISDAEFDIEAKHILDNMSNNVADNSMLKDNINILENIIDEINLRFRTIKSFNESEVLRAHQIRDQAIKMLNELKALNKW